MHASHSESSKKYTTDYANYLLIKYEKQFIRYSGDKHYAGFLEINLSAGIKLVPPLMEPALQILKPAS